MNDKNLEDVNEEFNNFMHRVTEVTEIMKKLNSEDKAQQDIGTMEADRYLGRNYEEQIENLDDGREVVLNVKSDRTVINKRGLGEEGGDGNTMSQEAFKDEVSKDADKRHRDRLVRTEKMETFKKRATLAFRRGEYERALCCYNKAIEQIKDSPLLYNNRSLTHLNLKMYEKAIEDAETALRLNEDCLKSFLFLAKAYFLKGHEVAAKNYIKEAKNRHPKQTEFIQDFYNNLKEGK